MFELIPIAENEVCKRENVTVDTGSYAVDALETDAESPLWLGLVDVGSEEISVEV
jgi:hypothetical protein